MIGVALAKTASKIPKVEVPSLWGYTFRIVLALGVILTVVIMLAYILRKMKGSPPLFGKRRVEVLEFTPIMGKWALATVRVGKRFFLIGLSEGNIQLISELQEKDLKEESFERVLEENLNG